MSFDCLNAPGTTHAGEPPGVGFHDEVDEVKSTIKFQLKKVLCLNVAAGHVGMSEQQLIENLKLADCLEAKLLPP